MPAVTKREYASSPDEKRSLDKPTYAAVGLLAAYTLVRASFAAAGRSFWYDELLTQIVSSRNTWSGIVAALRNLTDGQPPLFYLIEAFASRLYANQQVALRIPSAVGVAGAVFCLFVYAKRRLGYTAGLFCALGLLLTSVFQYYAFEARPYGMLMGVIAFALVCYQRAGSTWWQCGFALCLVLAELLSHLAVLAFFPFVLSEIIKTIQCRRIRWFAWAGFALGAVPLIMSLKILRAGREYYAAHFFYSHFSLSSIPAVYGEILNVNSFWGGAIGVAAIAAVALMTYPGLRQSTPPADRASVSSIDMGEALLLLSFVALPFLGLIFAKTTHTGMTARYVLSASFGLMLISGHFFARTSKQVTFLAAVLILTAVGISEIHFWRDEAKNRASVAGKGEATRNLIASSGYQGLPIVVPNAGTLLGAVHDAYPGEPGRFVYLQRAENEPDITDSAEKGLLRVRDYLHIKVREPDEFYAENPSFLVYVEGQDTLAGTALRHALNGGRSVRLLRHDGFRVLYLVSRAPGG